MSKVKVYTASAGSGKTYSLTRDFLVLALNPKNDLNTFKTIQAVTFTNKATEEMKTRILDELNIISRSQDGVDRSDYMDYLLAELKCSERELCLRAEQVLRLILQDYSSFRVKTIDSFFQEVLRNLARELGLQGNFRPLIETKEIFDQAVLNVFTDLDQIISADKEEKEVKERVARLIDHLILEGKSNDPRKEVLKLVDELKKEDFYILDRSSALMSPDEINKYRTYCVELRDTLLKNLQEHCKTIISSFEGLGYSLEHVKYGSRGSALAVFYKLCNLKLGDLMSAFVKTDMLPKRLVSALEGDSFMKQEADEDLLRSNGFVARLEAYSVWVSKNSKLLYTLSSVLSFIDSYCFISSVDQQVKRLQKEENVILIKETSQLINEMLCDSSGVQFLYEKLGTKLKHHMIDEFQDTSRLQYENFKPLLDEAVGDEHGSCLIVGDVKQSIYRFRNSDSSLLNNKVPEDFGEFVEKIQLDTNWRSTAQVIAFNNKLYSFLPELIDQCFAEQEVYQSIPEEERLLFRNYYDQADVRQKVGRKSEDGQVAIYPCDLEKDEVPVSFVPLVEDLQKRGYKPSDIAILVRGKKDATLVAEALSEAKSMRLNQTNISYDFVSEEALEVQNAVSIYFVVAVLSYIAQPKSKYYRLKLEKLYEQVYEQSAQNLEAQAEDLFASSLNFDELDQIASRGLYELVELLFAKFRSILPSDEIAYQIKFLDLVYSFSRDKSATIADFLKMYQDSGCRKTISSPNDSQKMTLMTIHKSKGLGFPVVLMPFANWDIVPSSQYPPVLWCELGKNMPVELALEGSKVLPIRYSSALSKSYFAENKLKEDQLKALDELNLLYVATTRAKKELHLWFDQASCTSDKTIQERGFTNVSDWINCFLSKSRDDAEPAFTWLEPEETELEPQNSNFDSQNFQLDAQKNKVDSQNSQVEAQDDSSLPLEEKHICLEHLETYDIQGRIAVLRQGLDIFNEENPRLYGMAMHYVLSEVKVLEDLPDAIALAIAKGFISKDQALGLQAELTSLLSSVEETKRWFDPSVRVLNEVAILGGTSGVKRPDRVLIYPDNSVEIIDYKFGEPRNIYKKQLKTYKDLILKMGYSKVKAYIWYVKSAQVEAVV